MKEMQKEEVTENRMLLPELSASMHNYTPIQLEYLQTHERTQREIQTTQAETMKDVGAMLAPNALAALRKALAGKGPFETVTSLPAAKADGALSLERRLETRVPVLKTSAGSFLVTPTPQVSLSFPSRTPYPPRAMPYGPSQVLGLPLDQSFITTPERRINVQGNVRTAIGNSAKPPVSNYLVQAPGGQYCIMSGTEAARSGEGRMMPMDLGGPHGLLSNPTECRPTAPPTTPSHPMMFVKPMKTTVSLASKLQTSGRRSAQQLSQKLTERPNPPFLESLTTSGSLAAAAENLKNLFLSGNNQVPVTPIDESSFTPAPPTDFFRERSDVSHKRRKTSTPASLDDIPQPISAAQQAGLELLLQAVKSIGDRLPPDSDLQYRRLQRGRRASDDQSFSSRLAYCLNPALRQGLSVLDSFTGVYPLLDGSFIARCRFKGCYVLIGSFKTAEDAARAYDRVILSIRGRKAQTNYPYSEYLNFELQNAKRAFEAKYKQCEGTRRGSAWPWARAAQTLLANDEEGSDDGVSDFVQSVGPWTEDVSGKCVFELLQSVMLQRKDLNGTFDLIQSRIRHLKTRITSGLSTEEECDCVGQYACVARYLGSMVSMQNEWERKHRNQATTSAAALLDDTPPLSHTEQDTSDANQVDNSLLTSIPDE